MAINKVVYGNQTLMDLTDSTLTSSDELVEGVIAYDRSGNRITGTADYMDKVDNPTADKILIDDGNGQAQDSSVSIIDVALMSDVSGKQDVLTAGTGIDISNNVITNEFETLISPDLDDIKYNFSGYVRTVTNNPSGTNANGYLQVIARKGNTSYTMQIYTPYNSNNTYTRLNNTTWGAWQPLTMTAGTGISISDNGTIINRFANLANVDLNTIRYNCQAYATDTCTNKPTTYGGMFICTMVANDGNFGAQFFITYANTGQGVYYRRFNSSATPTAWVKLENELTNTTGTVTASTTNFTSPTFVLTKSGKVCTLYFTGTIKVTANGWITVGTIPSGYRPSAIVNFDVYTRSTSNNYEVMSLLDAIITTSGAIQIYAWSGNNNQIVRKQFTYICS